MRICSLASGSSGNCLVAGTKGTKVLVDGGLSGKKIVDKLQEAQVDVQDIKAILVTHEHSDHIQGVGVLSRKYDLPIYANQPTWQAMEKSLGKLQEKNKCILEEEKLLEIGDLQVESFPISHDAVQPVGYSLYHKKSKATVLTDTGQINKRLEDALVNSDLMVLESNHDVEMLKTGPYPYHLKRRILGEKGHLSNEQAGDTLSKVIGGRTKKVLLAHLSKENNFPDLAHLTVKSILEMQGIKIHKDLELELTSQEQISKILAVGE